jgi:hypothetical protein
MRLLVALIPVTSVGIRSLAGRMRGRPLVRLVLARLGRRLSGSLTAALCSYRPLWWERPAVLGLCLADVGNVAVEVRNLEQSGHNNERTFGYCCWLVALPP